MLCFKARERFMCGVWSGCCGLGAAFVVKIDDQFGIAFKPFGGGNIFDPVVGPQTALITKCADTAFG